MIEQQSTEKVHCQQQVIFVVPFIVSDLLIDMTSTKEMLQQRRGSAHKLNGTLSFSDDKDTSSKEGTPDLPETVKVAAAVRKISFPADSIINAVIQDGDVHELLQIYSQT